MRHTVNPIDPDLELFARSFAHRVAAAPDEALQQWHCGHSQPHQSAA